MTRRLVRRPRLLALVAVLTLVLVASGALLLLRGGGELAEEPAPDSEAAAELRNVPDAWAPAVSDPVEDSVYPAVGDPGVDALHYALDLDWDPDEERLTGEATITVRATGAAEDAGELRLDLGEPLEVEEVRLDGEEVQEATDDSELDTDGTEASYAHVGKDLVVAAAVAEDEVHELVVRYAGTPEPVEAPTTRGDFETTGWTVSKAGERLDDAGAVRRLLLVPRARPPQRQGLLRRGDQRARAAGRRRQRAARRARHRGRDHHDALGAGEPGRVLPGHDRDRRLRGHRGDERQRGAAVLLGAARRRARAPERSSGRPTPWPGSRSGWGSTPSSPSACC